MFSSGVHYFKLVGYQIPLDLPPGGARILAEDLFGMLSSIWAPGSSRKQEVLVFNQIELQVGG